MKVKKIYISGKITDLDYLVAYSNFEKAEQVIKEMPNSYSVNPMKIEHIHDRTWENYMLEDIKALFYCDAIYMLNNWGQSKGARIERAIALEMGIEIIYE
tara:strand:- start:618 stop:917 length:300 start_codon:yes stop_codon:yes gene_type:complete